jgi:uncharacterized protein with von Willebrand factor type A (vWA) domain
VSEPDRRSRLAEQTHWVECDSYDRHAFARLSAESLSFQALGASGARLLPHFEDFLLDLFALFFKLNVVLHSEDSVAPSARIFRWLIDEIRATPALEALRQQTVLDEATAGLAALLLGEALLEVLKSERVLTRAEMLDVWSLQQQEDEIRARRAQAETAEELRSLRKDSSVERQLRELQNRVEREAETGARRLEQQAAHMKQFVTESTRQRARIQLRVEEALRDLEAAREEADRWSLGLGGGHRTSPHAQIELGRRLAGNSKLKRMAQLVGRMRDSVRALRQRMYERSNTETYSVEVGADLSRLLPPELLCLRHSLLRRDFARRFAERELRLYSLRAEQQKGRGPMIVCLDGSSSMAGEKEIWSKAVTLTLLDIASRQRRRFRSICFSSTDTPLQVLDLNRRQRYAADMQNVFDLAEYFPGGGTDFQKPLAAALECLRHDRRKGGDIVFITDGECRVDPEWLAEFKREKERLGFSVYSVLIDVGASSLGALKEFSDRITSVTQLTTEATRDIFLKI